MKTIEKLMLPRCEVVGYYPQSPYNVGDILTSITENGTTLWRKEESGIDFVYDEHLQKSELIFRVLSWYERLEIDDMPKYVKTESEVREVIEFNTKRFMPEVAVTLIKPFGGYDREFIKLDKCLPATKQEYDSFIAKTTAK